MDFSEIFPGVTISHISGDSQFVVLSNGQRVIVKHVQSLNSLPFVHSQFNDSQISQIEFSPDSQLIALAYPKRGYVEIRKMPTMDNDEQLITSTQNWVAKIDDSGAGIEGFKWAPDSLQILIYSDFQQKISIYNLHNKAINYIKNPKYSYDKGTSFSNCGLFMAVAERREAKDFMGIYSTKDWRLLNHLQVETNDLCNLQWSSNDSCIAIWDSEIHYRMLIYCPCQGLQMKFQPYDFALGIKTIEFSKKGDILAIGSYDEKIRLINLVSLRLITELDHKPLLTQYKDIIVYKEEEFKDNFIGQKTVTKYVNIEPHQAKIQSLKIQPTQANPQQGVGQLSWSYDDTYIASRNDNMPNVLWIWEVSTLELKHVLIQLMPIKSFKWASSCQALVICTGSNKVYFWSPSSTSACDMPYEGRSYNVQKVEWSQDQKCLLLYEKSDVVVAYPQMDFINQQDFIEKDYQDF